MSKKPTPEILRFQFAMEETKKAISALRASETEQNKRYLSFHKAWIDWQETMLASFRYMQGSPK